MTLVKSLVEMIGKRLALKGGKRREKNQPADEENIVSTVYDGLGIQPDQQVFP